MKLLIFDFDGTIVDSKTAYYHAIEKYLAKMGLNRKEADKIIDVGMSINETLKNLGFGFLKRIFLKKQIMKDVLDKVMEVKKCRDSESIIKLEGKKILVSNSMAEFMVPVLKHLKLEGEFDEIYGADAFDSKKEFIREYIARNEIDKKECYYIGDRVADVKLARAIGIKSIIISNKCSWDGRKDLLKEKPDFVLFDLKDIKDII